MEPIPMYVRVLGIVLAAVASPLLVASVCAGTLRAAQINAEIHRTASYSVGTTPKLHVEAQFGKVVIERGEPGRIDVVDDHGTASITRAAAGSLTAQISVTVSQHADLLEVRQFSPIYQPTQLNRYSTLTVRVPAQTDLEVSCLGDVDVQGVDGNVRISTTVGHAVLRNSSLRGPSTITTRLGDIRAETVSVSGSAKLSTGTGSIVFNGALAPGSSSLDISSGHGDVEVTLPYKTDARASVASQEGNLHSDPVWHFTAEEGVSPRRWVADLIPNPTGSIHVTTSWGDIKFSAR
jgi:Putative adhesin